MNNGSTRLDPAWKQAVLDLLDTDPKPGDTIDDAWLEDHFDLPRPRNANAAEWNAYQLKRLKYTDLFKAELAEQFNIILSDRHQGCMRILAPAEVAEYTEHRAVRELRNALRRQSFRLKHTNVLDMTPEDRMRHIEASARVQLKARMLREAQHAALPEPKEKTPLPRIFQPTRHDGSDKS